MSKPVLSIGIIFKNEIRCLERCLKSLEPLREAIPCELVMADTGATDGSRLIAEKYADILFDFKWVNDFAAARNAVMDRCSGKWYFSIDCDEWLDGDIQELTEFVKNNHDYKYGGFTVRNYQTSELDKGDDYSDFYACRLLLMSTGLRFVGVIHERWPTEVDGTPKLLVLQRVLLHHDGYAHLDAEASKRKLERNMTLLRKRLEEDPKNLVTILQCIESSDGTPECPGFVREGARGVEERWTGWQLFGPPLLRYAAVISFRGNQPDLEKYIDMAREMFPQSIFTRIDVEFSGFAWSWKRKDYKECIRVGERYLNALDDYEAGRYDHIDGLTSTLTFRSTQWKYQVLIFMAASYMYENQTAKTVEILSGLDGERMKAKHVEDCMRVYARLHSRTDENVASMVVRLWEQISRPTPSEEVAEQRKNEFIRISSEVFLPAYQEEEKLKEDFRRPAYTLFLSLQGQCVLGDMAAILETDNPRTIEKILSQQGICSQLPASMLLYALEKGVCFPLPDAPLNLEEMDGMASRLTQEKERFLTLVMNTAEQVSTKDWQGLTWARGLVMAGVRTYPWSEEGQDEEQGLALARAFVKIEREFLPLCYAQDTLREDRLFLLPPMHRFGWYLGLAFQRLDNGDTVGYAQLLRKTLATCKEMKPMIRYLLEHTLDVKDATEEDPSKEIKALADQIREILSAYAPDDPAVILLKQSEAYQKVAYMIEGSSIPIMGKAIQ